MKENDVDNRKDDEIDWDINSACINFSSLVLHPAGFAENIQQEMSLDKAIEHGKEHRKPYTGSQAVFRSCRNHGVCLWCMRDRTHKFWLPEWSDDDSWFYPDDYTRPTTAEEAEDRTGPATDDHGG